MTAVACREAELSVVDRPEPVAGRGQVRIEVTRCGICGSDLHARHGIDDWADMTALAGYDRSDEPVVFGHEFVGEVAEDGPETKAALAPGTAVVALPPCNCSSRPRSCRRCRTPSRPTSPRSPSRWPSRARRPGGRPATGRGDAAELLSRADGDPRAATTP